MKVLSLCDGMSCGHIALDRVGIKVSQYFAAEIKETAIKVTQANYPNTIQIGDVNQIRYKDGVLYTEKGIFEVGHIDLVMFGSPCQTFSIAMLNNRIGLEDKEKSGLFLECHRILKEVNPTYFLMENVASMRNEDKEIISYMMGVEPLRINSEIIAPALRDRYYWTNIPNITPPQRKNISFQDILIEGFTNREKAHCLLVSDSRPLTTPVKMFHRYLLGFGNLIFKSEEQYEQCQKYYAENFKGMKAKDIPTNATTVFDGVRFPNQTELERLQTVPEGYTNCLTRDEAADVLGDGWTIDVIAHIFTFLPQETRSNDIADKLNDLKNSLMDCLKIAAQNEKDHFNRALEKVDELKRLLVNENESS